MNSLFIKEFIDDATSDLKRIAYQTKGEYSPEDLLQEVYFYIMEFHEVHDRYPSPWDNQDKSWVLGRMFNAYVKWADHDFRNAKRINGLEHDSGETWDLELQAQQNSDPFIELLYRESSVHLEKLLKFSYSEAKAYFVAFGHFDSDRSRLSNYLLITEDTLDNRCARAVRMVEQQPSLFDYIEVIDEWFYPHPGQEKTKTNTIAEISQLAFGFT